jgi:predicted nucleotide-binding protein
MVYSGISPVTLRNCRFEDCKWSFAGPSGLTVKFMSAIYNGTDDIGRQLIESTFDEIRHAAGASSGQEALINFKPHIFVGHGGSRLYIELSDFLRGRGFSVETFESDSRAGYTAKEVLEQMARRASMAFLVHTAEDEQADQKVRARQNVVHETGLFQGRLGFHRAIILREDGCEDFSNLHGVQEIRFPPGDIKSRFLQVLDVINREFPQPTGAGA